MLFDTTTHEMWLLVFYRWMMIASKILEKWRSDFENVSVLNDLNWELIWPKGERPFKNIYIYPTVNL